MSKVGWVAIIGRPNSGKSTLLNRVLGSEISIVTAKAQTTRDRIIGILTEEKGQMIFVDTPGIHKAKEGGLNHYMVSQAREALEAASVIWYVLDPGSALHHEEAVIDILAQSKVPVFLILNKTDLGNEVAGVRLLEIVEQALRVRGADIQNKFKVSGLMGTGVEPLLNLTWDSLSDGPPMYPDPDQLSDRPMRYIVSEKIREQVYLHLGEELPYSCAVQIEKFEESTNLPRIEAVIHVERESQKPIVIGKGGKMIKEIGQSSRQQIESFMGKKVFLGLKVRVQKDWSRSAEGLRRVGYL